MLLYITLPPLLQSRIQLLENAREVFRYLVFYFHDCEPIVDPRAKKLVTCANEDKRYPSAESPTSENAATERLANAKQDEELDLPTKALNRGTKDVNDGNVGHIEDPRTSLEASAKGTSAECAEETTPVVLESAPHETQNQPQNSLQATPRLPTEGKPSECKQEVAESVVTVGRTKGMVRTANLPEMDTDVDRTALLGGELAERVCGVDEGDETDREYQSRIQQTKKHQRNANANMDVPSAHKLLLEGEWTVYASGEDQNLRADHPSKSKEAEDTAGVQSEGCEGGTSWHAGVDKPETVVECCQQLCMASGDGDHEVECVDAPHELMQLQAMSIQSEEPDSGGIPRVCLGCTSWRAGDANGPGRRTDGSSGQADVSRGRADELRGFADTLNASNRAEMAGMSCGEGAGTYLGVGDAKRIVNATNGVRRHADALTGPMDVPSVYTDAIITANMTETVSIPPKRTKPPNSRARWLRGCVERTNGRAERWKRDGNGC